MQLTKRIHISGLSKSYGDLQALNLQQSDFAIEGGEKFGVIGPNGAGKTTLISILSGILPPTAGQIQYYHDAQELSLRDIKKYLGFVPQDFAFYEELTALQNMLYFGALYGLKRNAVIAHTEEIFDTLDMQSIAGKKAKTFSGGMKRRLNLALGIIHKPALLFIDEPTVGADVQSKQAMLNYLDKLNAGGTTIVYTSHHMQEAQLFCHRIAFLNKGRLIAYDTPESLMQAYQASDMESLFIKLSMNEKPATL